MVSANNNEKIFPLKEYHKDIMISFEKSDWKKMNILADKVIKYYPQVVYGFFFKGLAMDELGEHKVAIDYYTKSIEIKPTGNAYQNRGLAYFNDKQYDNAIIDYNKALEYYPNDEIIKEQKELAIYAKKGIITKQGNNTNFQSINDPFYLAEQYKKVPDMQKKEINSKYLSDSENTLPLYYILIAEEIYNNEKIMQLFYIS